MGGRHKEGYLSLTCPECRLTVKATLVQTNLVGQQSEVAA